MKNEIHVLYVSINMAWVRGNDRVVVVFALAKIIVGNPIKNLTSNNNQP